MSKDVVYRCVHCGEDTSFGSGRFVNRIPADDGYSCAECMAIECDRCDEPIPLDEDITPYDVYPEADGVGFSDGNYRVHYECLTKDEQIHYKKLEDLR